MKTNKLFLLAASALLFANCAHKEIDVPFNTGVAVAVMEAEDTKSSTTDEGYFTWTEGDAIWINTEKGNLKGTLSDGADSPNGTFSYSYVEGQVPTGYAMYPYSAGHKINAGVITFNMPASYDLGATVSNTNAPMLAVPAARNNESTVNFNFSHLGGVIRVIFKNAPVGTDRFTLSLGDAKINGEFEVANGIISSAETETPEETVTTLNFTALTSVQDITLFVPVPVGNYTGIEAKLYKDTEVLGTWGSEAAENNVERKSLILMSPITFSTAGGNIENNQQVATEKQLNDAIARGGIVTLTEDITLGSAVFVTKDITLDLNGYSIKPTYKGYGTDQDAMFIINVGAKLTVEDTSVEKTGVIDTDDGAITSWSAAHCVTAIKLQGTENYSSGPISSFVLNGGKIKGTAYGISGNGSRGGTEVTINGGVVDSYHSGAAIFNPQMGTVTVTGGEVISTVGIEMRSGSLNVTGGTITARAEYELYINGASASGASYSDGVIIGVSQHTTNNPLNINISGGTFNIENAGYDGLGTYYALYEEDYQDENSDNITMSITGGTFTGKIKSENCEDFITGGTFSDASAFNYLGNNADVTLGANITLSSVVNIKKTVTINLNGKDIIHPASSGDAYGDVFDVLTGGNLTILGEGRVISENGYSVYAGGDAKFLLEKGKYYSPVSAVYAQKAAVVTIVGGEYYADVEPTSNTPEHSAEYGQNFTLNLRDKKNNNVGDTSEIIVKGGKFYMFNPADNIAEGEGTNFVAPGYSSVADGDYYEVKEGIFNETALKAAIVNGAEITLSADMTLEKAITIPTDVTATINLNGFDVTAPNTDVFEVAGTLTIKGTEESVVSAGTANPNASVCAVWANGGTVTIDGGYYKAYSDAAGKRNDCIYAGYNADNNNTAGKITINGGKFEYVWPGTKNSGIDYNGDMFLLNCADKDLYETLITVNAGQFKNNVPSYEATTPSGRPSNEVRLGDGKKVYNGETEVTAAHNGTTDIWYVVK